MFAMDSVHSRSRRLNTRYLSCEDPELFLAAIEGWTGFRAMAIQRLMTQADMYNVELTGLPLIQLLPTGMMLDATDPRDKIYGLLGLATDTDGFMDLVSYKESDTYPQVYRSFAKRFTEKGGMAQVL